MLSVNVVVGQTFTITATPDGATTGSPSFNPDNPAIASLNESGNQCVCTATAQGQVNITVSGSSSNGSPIAGDNVVQGNVGAPPPSPATKYVISVTVGPVPVSASK